MRIAECGVRRAEGGMLNVEKGREVRKGGDCGLRNNRDGELGGLATWRENRIGKGLTRRRQGAKLIMTSLWMEA